MRKILLELRNIQFPVEPMRKEQAIEGIMAQLQAQVNLKPSVLRRIKDAIISKKFTTPSMAAFSAVIMIMPAVNNALQVIVDSPSSSGECVRPSRPGQGDNDSESNGNTQVANVKASAKTFSATLTLDETDIPLSNSGIVNLFMECPNGADVLLQSYTNILGNEIEVTGLIPGQTYDNLYITTNANIELEETTYTQYIFATVSNNTLSASQFRRINVDSFETETLSQALQESINIQLMTLEYRDNIFGDNFQNETVYKEGDIIVFNNTEYIAKWSNVIIEDNINPSNSDAWEQFVKNTDENSGEEIWNKKRTYAAGDRVLSSENKLYIATRATKNENPASKNKGGDAWQEITEDSPEITSKLNWFQAKTYSAGSIVERDGLIFQAKKASRDKDPLDELGTTSTYWEFLPSNINNTKRFSNYHYLYKNYKVGDVFYFADGLFYVKDPSAMASFYNSNNNAVKLIHGRDNRSKAYNSSKVWYTKGERVYHNGLILETTSYIMTIIGNPTPITWLTSKLTPVHNDGYSGWTIVGIDENHFLNFNDSYLEHDSNVTYSESSIVCKDGALFYSWDGANKDIPSVATSNSTSNKWTLFDISKLK